MTTPQHRADLFLDPGSDPRQGGPQLGDERATAVVEEAWAAWREEIAFADWRAGLDRARPAAG